MKKIRICFTGHRPNKLKGGYDLKSKENKDLAIRTIKAIKNIIKQHDDLKEIELRTGGAIGFDQLAFICSRYIKLHEEEKGLKVYIELCIPFLKQSALWSKTDKQRHESHKMSADKCIYVDCLKDYKLKNVQEDEYDCRKMQKRNEYMVDNSDYVIAAWDFSNGGTANCVKYSKKISKNIIYISI